MDLARERYSEVFESNMFKWCPEGDLNPHNPCGSADFKSAASANFAIRAQWDGASAQWYLIVPCDRLAMRKFAGRWQHLERV